MPASYATITCLRQFLQAVGGQMKFYWGRSWLHVIIQIHTYATESGGPESYAVYCNRIVFYLPSVARFNLSRPIFYWMGPIGSSNLGIIWRKIQLPPSIQHFAVALVFSCLCWPDLIWLGAIVHGIGSIQNLQNSHTHTHTHTHVTEYSLHRAFQISCHWNCSSIELKHPN